MTVGVLGGRDEDEGMDCDGCDGVAGERLEERAGNRGLARENEESGGDDLGNDAGARVEAVR